MACLITKEQFETYVALLDTDDNFEVTEEEFENNKSQIIDTFQQELVRSPQPSCDTNGISTLTWKLWSDWVGYFSEPEISTWRTLTDTDISTVDGTQIPVAKTTIQVNHFPAPADLTAPNFFPTDPKKLGEANSISKGLFGSIAPYNRDELSDTAQAIPGDLFYVTREVEYVGEKKFNMVVTRSQDTDGVWHIKAQMLSQDPTNSQNEISLGLTPSNHPYSHLTVDITVEPLSDYTCRITMSLSVNPNFLPIDLLILTIGAENAMGRVSAISEEDVRKLFTALIEHVRKEQAEYIKAMGQ